MSRELQHVRMVHYIFGLFLVYSKKPTSLEVFEYKKTVLCTQDGLI